MQSQQCFAPHPTTADASMRHFHWPLQPWRLTLAGARRCRVTSRRIKTSVLSIPVNTSSSGGKTFLQPLIVEASHRRQVQTECFQDLFSFLRIKKNLKKETWKRESERQHMTLTHADFDAFPPHESMNAHD